MQTEFLIIGQGLCGTWLSWFLQKQGREFLVIDRRVLKSDPETSFSGCIRSESGNALQFASPEFSHPTFQGASRVASGVINPVTGRRLSVTWMAEELFPFVFRHYKELESALETEIIRQTSVINFFPTPQMKDSYEERYKQGSGYVSPWWEGEEWKPYFQFEFGAGEISPVYWIRLRTMLDKWREILQKKSQLIEDRFNWEELEILHDSVRYKGITAKYLIICDGAEAINNPFFGKLPHALNKGEALLISAPELPITHIYKRGITIVPWEEPGLFWVGSTYQHNFADPAPTADFLRNTTRALDNMLKVSYEIKDHWAAVRPSTIERRPFVGIHPKYPQLAILNGMGTKGCSLAPYFAHELTRLFLHNEPLNKAADINRFQQILMTT